MPEQIILTAPETFPSITEWSVAELTIDAEFGVIVAKLKSNLGTYAVYREQDTDTMAAIRALNTANLSVKSLQRRVLERVHARGFKVGTLTGSPDV